MDISKKKMKRASVSFDQSNSIDDEAKAKLKYQTLLEEYLGLQKEYVSRKRKLQAAKQKRETVLAEVRFLRRRRKYLLKCKAPNVDKVHLHSSNSDIRNNALEAKRIHSSSSEAAAETFDVSSSHLQNEKNAGSNEQVHEEEVRFTKNVTNQLIQDKVVGKRKIGWPGQVSLKV